MPEFNEAEYERMKQQLWCNVWISIAAMPETLNPTTCDKWADLAVQSFRNRFSKEKTQ